eukprot:4901301-Alexandrium_andersonii.AAC.1
MIYKRPDSAELSTAQLRRFNNLLFCCGRAPGASPEELPPPGLPRLATSARVASLGGLPPPGHPRVQQPQKSVRAGVSDASGFTQPGVQS